MERKHLNQMGGGKGIFTGFSSLFFLFPPPIYLNHFQGKKMEGGRKSKWSFHYKEDINDFSARYEFQIVFQSPWFAKLQPFGNIFFVTGRF